MAKSFADLAPAALQLSKDTSLNSSLRSLIKAMCTAGAALEKRATNLESQVKSLEKRVPK